MEVHFSSTRGGGVNRPSRGYIYISRTTTRVANVSESGVQNKKAPVSRLLAPFFLFCVFLLVLPRPAIGVAAALPVSGKSGNATTTTTTTGAAAAAIGSRTGVDTGSDARHGSSTPNSGGRSNYPHLDMETGDDDVDVTGGPDAYLGSGVDTRYHGGGGLPTPGGGGGAEAGIRTS